MDLSVIIISYNTKKLLKECIDSVLKTTKGIKYEIIVVDNASSDGSVEMVKKYSRMLVSAAKRMLKRKKGSAAPIRDYSHNPTLRLVENRANLGFGTANNQAIMKSRGRYILLLNSDTLINDNVLGEMVQWMNDNSKVGIASCALKNKDGSMQGTGGYFPSLPRVFSWMTIQDLPFVDKLIKPFHPMHKRSLFKGASFYSKKKELDWVTGAFFLMRREVYENIGLFDEDYFMYTEEVDYCYRAKKAGWKVYYLPSWSLVHYDAASGKSWSYVLPEYEGVKLFYNKHYSSWQYPILRLFLKIGALGRMLVFGILEGKEAFKVYAEAFKKA